MNLKSELEQAQELLKALPPNLQTLCAYGLEGIVVDCRLRHATTMPGALHSLADACVREFHAQAGTGKTK